MPWRRASLERLCVPVWTMRLYLRAASTLCGLPRRCAKRASRRRHPCPPGRPRSSAASASGSAWRWRWRRLLCLSSSFRTSVNPCTVHPLSAKLFTPRSRILLSASQRATTRTPVILLKASMWLLPLPPNPTTPTRISLFAPCTRAQTRAGRARATAESAVVFKKSRRRIVFITLCGTLN